MVDTSRSGIYIRDGEADIREANPEGVVQEVRHYVLRAETGILTGLLLGERDDNRVQGASHGERSDEDDRRKEGQS